jgi:hypothetical protein
VIAQHEIAFDAILDRNKAEFLQTEALHAKRRFPTQLSVWAPVPARERIAKKQHGSGRIRMHQLSATIHKALKRTGVKRVPVDYYSISVSLTDNLIIPEFLAEVRYVTVKRGSGRLRRRTGPDGID